MTNPTGLVLALEDSQADQLAQTLMDALDIVLDPLCQAVDRQNLAERLEHWSAILEGAGEFDPTLLEPEPPQPTETEISKTYLFWRCNCQKAFIHPWYGETCSGCGAIRSAPMPTDVILTHPEGLPEGLVNDVRRQVNREIILRCMAAIPGQPAPGETAYSVSWGELAGQLAVWLVEKNIPVEQISKDALLELLDRSADAVGENDWDECVQDVFDDVWAEKHQPAPDAHLEQDYEDRVSGCGDLD